MEKVLAFLKENPTFFFATVDGDKPKVRPFGFHMVYNDKLCFGIGRHKKSFKQILENPQIEICACSPKGQWLRICGTVCVIEDPAAVEEAFKVMPELKGMYNEQTGQKLGIVALNCGAVAEIADFSGQFEQIIL